MSNDVYRKNRSIRFSDYEWEVIKKAAKKSDVAAGTFVHDAALDAAAREDLVELAKELRMLISEMREKMAAY